MDIDSSGNEGGGVKHTKDVVDRLTEVGNFQPCQEP